MPAIGVPALLSRRRRQSPGDTAKRRDSIITGLLLALGIGFLCGGLVRMNTVQDDERAKQLQSTYRNAVDEWMAKERSLFNSFDFSWTQFNGSYQLLGRSTSRDSNVCSQCFESSVTQYEALFFTGVGSAQSRLVKLQPATLSISVTATSKVNNFSQTLAPLTVQLLELDSDSQPMVGQDRKGQEFSYVLASVCVKVRRSSSGEGWVWDSSYGGLGCGLFNFWGMAVYRKVKRGPEAISLPDVEFSLRSSADPIIQASQLTCSKSNCYDFQQAASQKENQATILLAVGIILMVLFIMSLWRISYADHVRQQQKYQVQVTLTPQGATVQTPESPRSPRKRTKKFTSGRTIDVPDHKLESTSPRLKYMTVEDVADALTAMGCGQYASSFLREGIDGTFLLLLDDEILEVDLAVSEAEDRKKIMRWIQYSAASTFGSTMVQQSTSFQSTAVKTSTSDLVDVGGIEMHTQNGKRRTQADSPGQQHFEHLSQQSDSASDDANLRL